MSMQLAAADIQIRCVGPAAAEIIQVLSVRPLGLMTNNPRKKDILVNNEVVGSDTVARSSPG